MLFNTPYWLRLLGGSGLTWQMPGDEHGLYLTFDDGPDPETTPLILDMLLKYDARATFFCVGENVEKYPEYYKMYLDSGHAVGNHSWDHSKGWETHTRKYLEAVQKCSEVVNSTLFRPPYGKMTRAQQKALRKDYNIIMWTVLSRDYDNRINAARCLDRTWRYTRPGAIILFHDSKKTIDKLNFVLPSYLELAKDSGYSFKGLGVEG